MKKDENCKDIENGTSHTERSRVGKSAVAWSGLMLSASGITAGDVLFCVPKENQKSTRYFRSAGGTNQGLLALDNPKAERLHTKNPSRYAKGFFVFRRFESRLRDELRGSMPVAVATFPLKKVSPKRPQSFRRYKYKNIISSNDGQSERGGHFQSCRFVKSSSLLLALP